MSLGPLASIGVAPWDAEAHPNHGAALGERYVKLDVGPQRTRVVYGLTYPSTTSVEVRRESDADGDGVVSASEAEARLGQVVAALERGVSLTVDGRRVDLAWGAPFVLGLSGPGARGPITIEVAAGAVGTVRGGELVLTDSAEFAGVYRTTVTLATGSEVGVERAGPGPSPQGLQTRAAYLDLPDAGPPAPRVFVAAVRVPEVERGAGPEDCGWTAAAALAAVLVVIGAAAGWRWRRRRSTGPGTDSAR
jgi:hypothetical protein